MPFTAPVASGQKIRGGVHVATFRVSSDQQRHSDQIAGAWVLHTPGLEAGFGVEAADAGRLSAPDLPPEGWITIEVLGAGYV